MLKRIILFSILMLFVIPGNLFANEGQNLTIDGYQLNISVTKLSDKLVVFGSIKGGENCGHLSLTVYLVDEKGSRASVSVVIRNYQYSDRFTAQTKNTTGGELWDVSDVYLSRSCIN
ncbi:MAG: hypothetical protein GY710_25880 [Desulfobacteraceae bacterium]|nr:hypothetical protein [Desulfobacteraceae bacterium]